MDVEALRALTPLAGMSEAGLARVAAAAAGLEARAGVIARPDDPGSGEARVLRGTVAAQVLLSPASEGEAGPVPTIPP